MRVFFSLKQNAHKASHLIDQQAKILDKTPKFTHFAIIFSKYLHL